MTTRYTADYLAPSGATHLGVATLTGSTLAVVVAGLEQLAAATLTGSAEASVDGDTATVHVVTATLTGSSLGVVAGYRTFTGSVLMRGSVEATIGGAGVHDASATLTGSTLGIVTGIPAAITLSGTATLTGSVLATTNGDILGGTTHIVSATMTGSAMGVASGMVAGVTSLGAANLTGSFMGVIAGVTGLSYSFFGEILQVLDPAWWPTGATYTLVAHFRSGTGTVYARLYNVTDSAPVAGSTCQTATTTTPVVVESGAFTLAAGQKTYRIEKGQSGVDSGTMHQAEVAVTWG